MAVIAEFTIGQDEFPLGAAMAGFPEISLELDRVLPVDRPGIPYVWATGEAFAEFEAIVRSSSLVESLTRVDQSGDSALYRIEWVPDARSLIQELAASNVGILEAYRETDGWFFRLRFDDHADLIDFHAFCSENDISYTLTRVYPDGERRGGATAFGLSQEQFDTLVLAVERGYFGVPRGVTLGELGAELGISQQAASERVRRATDRVLRTVLVTRTPSAAPEPAAEEL